MNRTREQVIWDFVQGWLQKAEGDLGASERLLEIEEFEDRFISAFHAQQAAEKYLKAFLVRHQIPFPKTHVIQQLLQLAARADSTIESALASSAMLTPFGTEFRYPGEVIDLETAKQAIREAKHVREAVLQRLKDYLAKGHS
jgi:HEPN domain-containing protein